jgi:hypothetical protein
MILQTYLKLKNNFKMRGDLAKFKIFYGDSMGFGFNRPSRYS